MCSNIIMFISHGDLNRSLNIANLIHMKLENYVATGEFRKLAKTCHGDFLLIENVCSLLVPRW